MWDRLSSLSAPACILPAIVDRVDVLPLPNAAREVFVMTRSRVNLILTAVFVIFAGAPSVVHAGVFRDIGVGLGYAGFNLEGGRNILSGGADFRISRNLVGQTLDFGSADLTLSGPISLEFSTGGRLLSNMDISLQTAMTGNQASSPLGYVLNYDVGGQSTAITGSIFIDANLSLNGFGFYDLELAYSSRQDVERDGRFSNSEDTYDLDIGPINVSGNIFADALALVTAPFFEGTDQTNPFASFSGRTQLQKLIETSSAEAQQQLAAGDPVDDSLFLPLTAGIVDGLMKGTLGSPDFTPSVQFDGVVPEPTVLLLMILGMPLVMRRRPRHRRKAH
jgi:hypothetical protein